jgi:hypothetical protein
LPSLGEVEATLAALDKEAEEHALRGASTQARVNSRRLRHWPEAMVALLRDGSGPFAEAFPAAREPSARASLTLPFEVQALRLGPLAIVGLPVEPLGAIGHALRDLAPGLVPATPPANAPGATSAAGAAPEADAWVWCAGYANGCYGYLPPADEYPRGGYEVDSAYRYYGQIAPFAPTCAALALGEAAAALKTLFG